MLVWHRRVPESCGPARPAQPCGACRAAAWVRRQRRVSARLQPDWWGPVWPGQQGRRRLLTLYVEAFERDADPEDFSLEAMIAHECGHQLLARHPRLARRVAGISEASEEILASLLGAMICDTNVDRDTLFAKATAELLDRGQSAESANRQLQQLWELLEMLL